MTTLTLSRKINPLRKPYGERSLDQDTITAVAHLEAKLARAARLQAQAAFRIIHKVRFEVQS